jgi:hypothetical protein
VYSLLLIWTIFCAEWFWCEVCRTSWGWSVAATQRPYATTAAHRSAQHMPNAANCAARFSAPRACRFTRASIPNLPKATRSRSLRKRKRPKQLRRSPIRCHRCLSNSDSAFLLSETVPSVAQYSTGITLQLRLSFLLSEALFQKWLKDGQSPFNSDSAFVLSETATCRS